MRAAAVEHEVRGLPYNWDVGFRHPNFYCFIYDPDVNTHNLWEGYGKTLSEAVGAAKRRMEQR